MMTDCGLPGITRIPYGVHMCSFYRTREELAATLVPYFVAGLRANERCIWITAEPLLAHDALTALRDRLQELLRSRPGRLADLLEVERELARVQSEIDSIQSNLAVMRTRVAMSELTINYRSAPRPVGSDTFRPLRDALANFLGIVVGGFAAIITIIAGLIPVAVVVVPIVWLILRWRKRRGGRFFRRGVGLDFEKPEPPPPPAAGA